MARLLRGMRPSRFNEKSFPLNEPAYILVAPPLHKSTSQASSFRKLPSQMIPALGTDCCSMAIYDQTVRPEFASDSPRWRYDAGTFSSCATVEGVAAMANTSTASGIPRRTSTSPIENNLVVEDVRSLAYMLYESRGREDGHDLDDWLLAEQRIKRGIGIILHTDRSCVFDDRTGHSGAGV